VYIWDSDLGIGAHTRTHISYIHATQHTHIMQHTHSLHTSTHPQPAQVGERGRECMLSDVAGVEDERYLARGVNAGESKWNWGMWLFERYA